MNIEYTDFLTDSHEEIVKYCFLLSTEKCTLINIKNTCRCKIVKLLHASAIYTGKIELVLIFSGV